MRQKKNLKYAAIWEFCIENEHMTAFYTWYGIQFPQILKPTILNKDQHSFPPQINTKIGMPVNSKEKV